MRQSFRQLWLLAVLVLIALPGVAAAQFTWLGTGPDTNWTTGLNWVGGSPPPTNSTTTALTFNGTTGLISTVDQAYTINSLTFGTSAGAYTINGTSLLTFGGTNPALTMNGSSAVAINAPVAFSNGGTIGGAGSGTLTISDLSALDGTLTINRDVTVGTLRISSDAATSPTVTVNSGTNVITLTGDIVFNNPPPQSTSAPPGVLAGIVTLTAGNHTFVSFDLSKNLASPFIDFTISALLQGPGGFVKQGSPGGASDHRAWLLLSNQNTYAGPTILQANSEWTYLGVNNALPTTTALQVQTNAELWLTNDYQSSTTAFSQTVGSLSDGGTSGGKVHLGPANTAVNSAVLTVGTDNTSTTFAGLIDNGGSLVKTGTGTLTLTGQNIYFGGTTVSGGVLLVNGQTGTNTAGALNSGTGTGAVMVNSGGTFGGTGQASGAVTVNAGGTIRAGNASGVGTLTLGSSLTLGSGATLGVRVTDASVPSSAPGGSTVGTLPNPTSNNFLNVTGPLTATAASLHVLIDGTGTTFTPGRSYSYQVGTFGGLPSGFSVTDQSQFTAVGFDPTPFSFSLTGDGGGHLFLNFTPVPEPATVLGLAAGIGLLGLARRRRT